MSHTTKFGAILMVALMLGAPLMGCLLPGGALTDEEQACCRNMGGECGPDQMPSSHSCCKSLVSVEVAVATKAFALHPLALILYLSPQRVSDPTHAQIRIGSSSFDPSPPETPPSFPDILRI